MPRTPVDCSQRGGRFRCPRVEAWGAVSAAIYRYSIAMIVAFAIAASEHGAGATAAPQNLAGTTLQPIGDSEALVESLIEIFTGGGSQGVKPSIDRVLVAEDTDRRLVVAVSYSGFANLQIEGDVYGRDRRRPQLRTKPVALTTASGEATLAFELPSGTADEGSVESAYLRLTAVDPARSRRVMSRVYALPKKWLPTPAAANTVIKATPQPIGTAARLGDRPDYARPPRILVPVKPYVTGTVRDHRTEGERGTVRDHRRSAETTRQTPAAAAAGVADRRVADAARQPPPPATPASIRVADSVRDHRKETATKTKPAAELLPVNARVTQLERFRYGVKPEDAEKGAQGPAAAPIELLEGLSTEDIGLNPAALLRMASSIYPDKNPASGVFYYHPRSYHLVWTPDSGHAMRILYGAAAGDAASADVLMSATLQSGLDLSEVQLAQELLNAYKRRNPSTVFSALRPLPLEEGGLDVSLAAVLGQYSIPKEKVVITGLSDVLGEIEVSWVTDPVTKENVQLALMQDVGVSGGVTFSATGGALAPQVPISIQLADRDSFGRLRWNRAEGHRNLTPYPIRLRYLHALVIDPRNNLPILYTWSLDNIEVPPQARVQWDAARVPAWIDTEAKRVWIDYGVVDNCDPCDREVLDRITGGVTSITADQITFHTITPLADVGGYEITAHIRSKYFDPKDRAELQKAVVLKADNQDFTLKPIYNVQRGAGEPLFEYLLELAMPDGTTYKGTRWIASDGLRVLIGRAQLEQSLGTLPGKQP